MWLKLTSDAGVSDGVVGNKVDEGVHLLLLGERLLRGELPQAVEPGELEELLGEEEAGDEEGLGREEGHVAVVDILHVGARHHAIVYSVLSVA